MISRAALAMFLELGVEAHGGSRALGQSHTNFFLLALQSLADQVALTMQSASVRRLVEYNFGEDAPMPKLVAANVQSRDLAELADTLTKFATAGLTISDEDLRRFIRQELALPAESAALKGAVAAPRGLTIADENEMKGGGEIQGKGAGQVEGEGKPAPLMESSE
jgi:phage gp29-like protein